MAQYTEMCCRNGGSNLNSGSRNGGNIEPALTPDFEYLSGSWDSTTGIFTVASGNPLLDGVQVGDFASIYADGSANTGFIGRITAVDSTTITASLTIRLGSTPTSGTNNRSLRIGGAWLGHNGIGFPVSLNVASLTNLDGHPMRINFKNDRVHSITSTASWTDFNTRTFSCVFEGYQNIYGDGGVAQIQGPSTGTAFVLWVLQRGKTAVRNLWFDRNGGTGSASLITSTTNAANSAGIIFDGCLFSNSRGQGLYLTNQTTFCRITSCSFLNNLLSGYSLTTGQLEIRSANVVVDKCFCQSGSPGVNLFLTDGSSAVFTNCFALNGNAGFVGGISGGNRNQYYNCTSVGCSTGFSIVSQENTSFVDNCLAVNCSTAFLRATGSLSIGGPLIFKNCAHFGTNRFDTSSLNDVFTRDINPIILTANPFIDLANNDFRLNNLAGGGALLKQTGNGYFNPMSAGLAGFGNLMAQSYPDVGAMQSESSGGYYNPFKQPVRIG